MTVENSEKDAASDAIGCIPFCVFSGNREIRELQIVKRRKMRKITLSLKNYTSDNSEQADYEGFYALSISYFMNSEEESFKDPQTYTGIEGIKHLRIDSEMQKKAEEQGIDWYEIWPDLEDVVIID